MLCCQVVCHELGIFNFLFLKNLLKYFFKFHLPFTKFLPHQHHLPIFCNERHDLEVEASGCIHMCVNNGI